MTGYNCSYLQKYIEKNINVSGNFYKGKCFLYNDFNINKNKKDKIKEKKVLILEKRIGNNNDEFNALVVTLGEKEEIKTFINKVKNKTFEDIMNDKSLKVVKREISQNKVNEIIKNNKENEEEKKKKELEDKKKKEEEDKKKKEEENKKRKEEEEKKRKEEANVFDIPESLSKNDFLKDIKEGKEKGNL